MSLSTDPTTAKVIAEMPGKSTTAPKSIAPERSAKTGAQSDTTIVGASVCQTGPYMKV
jgi:hypothetical protein